MRFIITLITSLILLIPASGQGEWERVDLGVDFFPIYGTEKAGRVTIDDFHDVQFLDQDKGFISAGFCSQHFVAGVLFKTEDGGKNWNLISTDEHIDLSCFHFINESKGFSTGLGFNCYIAEVHTTSDSGYSWTETANLPSRFGDNYDVETPALFFLNDSIGWLADGKRTFKTIDGGENWYDENKIGGSPKSLYFIDDESGWAVGENGLISKYTLNGWVRIFGVTGLPLNKVFFVDQDNGWISGGYNSDDGFKPIFLKTVDSGENWTKDYEMNYLINDFYFENKDHGWAVGEYREERGLPPLNTGVILETFTGGWHWQVMAETPAKRLNALHFKDGVGWAVGDDGLVLKNNSIATGMKGDNKITNSNESLLQNYPNPFHSSTIITYQLPSSSNVELSIYDISGRKVATLVNERQLADRYEVEWDAEGMESGIYFCELKTGQGRQVMKMSIVR